MLELGNIAFTWFDVVELLQEVLRIREKHLDDNQCVINGRFKYPVFKMDELE